MEHFMFFFGNYGNFGFFLDFVKQGSFPFCPNFLVLLNLLINVSVEIIFFILTLTIYKNQFTFCYIRKKLTWKKKKEFTLINNFKSINQI